MRHEFIPMVFVRQQKAGIFLPRAARAQKIGLAFMPLPSPPSKKLATGLQACRSNVFWKGFASPPKTVAPETPAFRPGSDPTALKGGVSTGVSFTMSRR